VTVVAANVALPDPAGTKVTRVVSAREMRDAVLAAAETAGVVVMAAAVADYRPAARSAAKIKKDGQPPEPLRLTENPDILAGLAAARKAREAARSAHDPERAGSCPTPAPQVLVGFAAETDTSPEQARPSWPGRAVTCSSSIRWGTGSASARRITRRSSTAPTGPSRRSRAGPRKPWPMWCGI
jgi:phosphopantothenoylcysteine synthetase/decarboxylase